MANCYIYFLFNSEDTLLYIGKSISVINRLRTHFSKTDLIKYPWKSTIDKKKVTLYKCSNTTDLDIYETYFINRYKPKYNQDKLFGQSPTFELPYLEPIVLLQQKDSLLSLYLKGNKEEQEAFVNSWKADRCPNSDFYLEETEKDLGLSYYLMIKNK